MEKLPWYRGRKQKYSRVDKLKHKRIHKICNACVNSDWQYKTGICIDRHWKRIKAQGVEMWINNLPSQPSEHDKSKRHDLKPVKHWVKMIQILANTYPNLDLLDSYFQMKKKQPVFGFLQIHKLRTQLNVKIITEVCIRVDYCWNCIIMLAIDFSSQPLSGYLTNFAPFRC